MDFSTTLLFIIACVIIIYFTWNFLNNRKRPNSKNEPDIRYYELKSKYEFLVAVVSLVTAVAVFYGLNTKKDIEKNITSELITRLKPTTIKLDAAEHRIDSLDNKLKNAQSVINSYYDVFANLQAKQKGLEVQQKLIEASSQLTKGKFKEFGNRIDTLNKKNILKRNFYLVDNLQIDLNALDKTTDHIERFRFDTLLTTLGDRLPKFRKPPIILPISDNGYPLYTSSILNDSFAIFVAPEWMEEPKNRIIHARLLITEVE